MYRLTIITKYKDTTIFLFNHIYRLKADTYVIKRYLLNNLTCRLTHFIFALVMI